MRNKVRENAGLYKSAWSNFEIKNRRKIAAYFFIQSLLVVFLCSTIVKSQNLPKEIRGYKVYNAKISVKNQPDNRKSKDESEVYVKIGEPEIADISLTGITLEIPAEIDSVSPNGTIDFLTFYDFRINNLKVEIEDYKESFEIRKNQRVILPKPINAFIATSQTLRGALEEFRASKEEWTVTGKVFIFGRFKKSFLKFKRVVPVEINLKIKNPFQNNE